MFQKFRENLIDEAVSGLLLRNIFRYRNHLPTHLDRSQLSPETLSGDRASFFKSDRSIVTSERHGSPLIISPRLVRHDLQFESEIQTPFPESNRVIYSRWSDPEHPNQRVIVGVDGIVQFRDSWFRTLAEQVVPAGWDVVMMDAPFNHRRTPTGYRPGQLLLGGNYYHLLNTGRQSILDLRSLVESLQGDAEEIGLIGVSLGGWMVTTLSQIVSPLKFLYAVTPPLEMSWMLREGGAIVRAAWQGLSQDDLSWDEMQTLMRPLSPYHYRPTMSPENIRFYTARYDRFVSTSRIEQYSKAIGAQLEQWPCGHITATCRREVAKDIGQQIREQFGVV
jgi:hypothetical protein